MRILLGIIAALLAINIVGTIALARWVFRAEIRDWKRERRRRRWAAEVRRNPPRTKWTSREIPRFGEPTQALNPRLPWNYYKDQYGNTVTVQHFPTGGKVGDVVIPPDHYLVRDGWDGNCRDEFGKVVRTTLIVSAEELATNFELAPAARVAGGNFKAPTQPGTTMLGGVATRATTPEDAQFADEVLKSLGQPITDEDSAKLEEGLATIRRGMNGSTPSP